MSKEKTYREIIIEYLEEKNSASINEIYSEIEKRKKLKYIHWKATVRSKLSKFDEFEKKNDKWHLRK